MTNANESQASVYVSYKLMKFMAYDLADYLG